MNQVNLDGEVNEEISVNQPENNFFKVSSLDP